MNDILFTILLYCDIKTIESYLCTSKISTLTIHFWKEKFNQNQLPIFNSVDKMEYRKINNINYKINKLHQLFELELIDEYLDIHIRFNFKNDDVKKLVSILPDRLQDELDINYNQDFQYSTQYISICYGTCITLEFSILTESIYGDSIAITTDEMKTTLIKIMYYYPYISIVDINDIDYILYQPYHRYAWPKHMKLLKSRSDFWTQK